MTNTLGFAAIRPAGLKAYPAIWTQDFTMAYSSGLVSREEGLAHLRLIAALQKSGPERLPGQRRGDSPVAVPDHIDLDGSPVFFPGTYSAGPDQGGEPWGICPPLNNYFDFIWLACLLWKNTAEPACSNQRRRVDPFWKASARAYAVPPADGQTGTVFTTPEPRAAGFIFCDKCT